MWNIVEENLVIMEEDRWLDSYKGMQSQGKGFSKTNKMKDLYLNAEREHQEGE